MLLFSNLLEILLCCFTFFKYFFKKKSLLKKKFCLKNWLFKREERVWGISFFYPLSQYSFCKKNKQVKSCSVNLFKIRWMGKGVKIILCFIFIRVSSFIFVLCNLEHLYLLFWCCAPCFLFDFGICHVYMLRLKVILLCILSLYTFRSGHS